MPIIIEVPRPNRLSGTNIGNIKITPEAETVLRELNHQTGLPIRYLASTIIIQAADQLEIREI